jgi:hypothetical protein
MEIEIILTILMRDDVLKLSSVVVGLLTVVCLAIK